MWEIRDSPDRGQLEEYRNPTEGETSTFSAGILLTLGMKSVRKSISRQQGYMKVLRVIDDNKLSE